MNVEIIFEDDNIIVVNKPNNMLVHNSHYARNIRTPTLLGLLKAQHNSKLYPVHRLDHKTSGVIILCKKKEFINVFQELFTNNKIIKSYYSIVRGFVNEKNIIDSPVKHPETKNYRDAKTICEPINKIELDIPVHPYKNSRFSLVKLIPQTGRIHQLRIHLNKISHPIIGDYKYGDRFHNRMFESEFKCENMFLHAYSLEFIHPFTSEKMNVKTSYSDNWNLIMNKFNWEIKK